MQLGGAGGTAKRCGKKDGPPNLGKHTCYDVDSLTPLLIVAQGPKQAGGRRTRALRGAPGKGGGLPLPFSLEPGEEEEEVMGRVGGRAPFQTKKPQQSRCFALSC